MYQPISRPLSCFLIAIAVCVCSTSTGQDSEEKFKVRRWLDLQSGKTVRASYAGHDNGLVRLETKKGQSYSIALDRLSAADQKYVRQFQNNPSREPQGGQADGLQRKSPEWQRLDQIGNGDNAAKLPGTKQLHGISWLPIDELITDLKIADDENKPVFWFRVLGELEGFM